MEQKCKICGHVINCHVFGSPPDICWGCLSVEKKKEVASINVKVCSSIKKDDLQKNTK